MAKNSMAKTRPADRPYLIYSAPGWTWKVLKAYSADPHKPYARWLTDVVSPYAHDLGDTYVADIVKNARLTFADPDVDPANIPDPKRVAADFSRLLG